MHVLRHEYDRGFVAPAEPPSPAAGDSFPAEPEVRVGGPRFGLIVSKAVGSAVIRHRVARRLRHMCAQVRADLPADADIVIRALPGAATADFEDMLRQLRTALRKLGIAGVRSS